jgi:hypothetical protein
MTLPGVFRRCEDAGENSYSDSRHLAAGGARNVHLGRFYESDCQGQYLSALIGRGRFTLAGLLCSLLPHHSPRFCFGSS